jgi:uncharacterized protein
MTDRNIEIRKTPNRLVVRSDDHHAGNILYGLAATFGQESETLYDHRLGEIVEVIDPNAFTRTLKEQPDIRALYNHDTNHVLGRTKSGTLILEITDEGLYFEVELPDTNAARDVKALVTRGDIDGCSFGFQIVKDKIEARDGLPDLRTLLDVDLFEISPAVVFPAYPSTEVNIRSQTRQARFRLHHSQRLLVLEEL